MISVDHSQCLMFAKSFEPTYILTITAVPAELRVESNKLNALYIQAFMSDLLSVPPERGVLRFEAIPEENLALNGMTVLGSMERMQGMRAGPKRLSSISSSGSPMPFDRTSSHRNSKRASDRIAYAHHLSRATIPERSASIRSGVSSLSNNDLADTSQHPQFSPRSSVLQHNSPSFDSLADMASSRNNDNRHSIQTIVEPPDDVDRRMSPRPTSNMDWRPATSHAQSYHGSAKNFDFRRDTVHQDYDDTALPPPPILRSTTPAPSATSTKRSRKSLLSVFRRK